MLMTVLCSRCGKEIPKGKETKIKRGLSKYFLTWTNWRGALGGDGIFCLPCVKKEKNLRKQFWTEFFCFNFLVGFVIFIAGIIILRD
jgi:hypothetical protein